jgi:hypothetical protein
VVNLDQLQIDVMFAATLTRQEDRLDGISSAFDAFRQHDTRDCPRCRFATWTFNDGRCVVCGKRYDEEGPATPATPTGIYDQCDDCGGFHPLAAACPLHPETEPA